MTKTLTSIFAAVTFLQLTTASFGQNAGIGPGAPVRNSMIYQPVLTTASLFQGDDLEVPIPQDPASGMSSNGIGAGTIQPQQNIPSGSGPVISSPDMSLPIYQENTTWNAFSPPVVADPFLQQQYGVQSAPYGAYQQPGIPPQGAFSYGANGAQPYRFGWQNRLDASWIPGQSVSGSADDLEIFGIDYELAYGTPWLAGWILNWTNQFSYRNWNGPDALGLNNDLFRFGIDFEFETPQAGPYSISLGVTPSINTDFQADAFDEGFQLDGRGILFMQLDQYWTLGLGAMYWDRVDDRILPWAGLIYRDDYWEWQLMYPEARISVFLGNEAYWAKWAYVRAEYHVEAYGVDMGGADTQIEIEDYRVLGGFKMDTGYYNWFIEGGWVFDRNIEYSTGATQELGSGFIGQIGVRF